MLHRLQPTSSPHEQDSDAKVGSRAHSGVFWSNILYIVYSLVVGVSLLFLPWMDIWDNNYLLFLHPRFRPIVSSAFLKGGVLGLGIVNIFVGIHEIGNLKKGPRRILSR